MNQVSKEQLQHYISLKTKKEKGTYLKTLNVSRDIFYKELRSYLQSEVESDAPWFLIINQFPELRSYLQSEVESEFVTVKILKDYIRINDNLRRQLLIRVIEIERLLNSINIDAEKKLRDALANHNFK